MNSKPQAYDFGPFRLKPAGPSLYKNGTPVPLTPKVLETLLALLERAGEVVGKEVLMQRIWPDTYVDESNLTYSISILRKALRDHDGSTLFIKTVPRRGYQFVAAVQRHDDLGPTAGEALAPAPVLGTECAVNRKGGATLRELNSLSPEPALRKGVADGLPLTVEGRGSSKRRRILSSALAVALVLFYGWWGMPGQPQPNLGALTITRLTREGNIKDACISPDGRHLAQVTRDGGLQSLWIKQISTGSQLQLVAPAQVRYLKPSFSSDGDFIFYVQRDGSNLWGTLYRIASLGGRPEKLLERVNSPVAVSPDGSQLAFVRESPPEGESALMVASVRGSSIRQTGQAETARTDFH
ncbi:MAG: winged helix-turn-helix domain-containing protein [Acidobacteria bacterium]|nr:winged helix-turn-helix domain-containing protein [Acidobacteriota bacterium]MCI0625140.1 winged helix-turn-helix domain-containing protein [Acidobacteriota bacterium]MCI0724228.1 winged helix-turn-helix domain-containing protein [Acidobacteriota bacterium]